MSYTIGREGYSKECTHTYIFSVEDPAHENEENCKPSLAADAHTKRFGSFTIRLELWNPLRPLCKNRKVDESRTLKFPPKSAIRFAAVRRTLGGSIRTASRGFYTA